MAEAEEGYIDFKARYGDWIAVKRMTIYRDTTPQKIAFHLAGIGASAESKSYKVLGIKTELLDELSSKATKGLLKKKYESLSAALAEMAKPEAQKVILSSIPDRSKMQTAAHYLMDKMALELGLPTAMSQKTLSKIYPELKPPRAPGARKMAK